MIKLKTVVLITLFITIKPLSVFSETTTHSSFHVPDGNSHNDLHSEGCEETKTVVVSKYIKSRQDKDTFYVIGADYEIRCLKWPAPPEILPPVIETKSVDLSWSPPTNRENGDDLPPEEIASYEIYITNGIATAVIPVPAPATSKTINDLSPGKYLLSIAAIDTDGLKSAPSDLIEVDL